MSGTVIEEESITFKVTKNISNGTLSVSSSDTNVADVSINGETITITGISEGIATITVTSSETSSYNAVSTTYIVHTILSPINANFVAKHASDYYGKFVNYTTGNESIDSYVKWQLFHSDGENIYLISSDYIKYSDTPSSIAGNLLNTGTTSYTSYFKSILNDYNGARSITDDRIKKWLVHVKEYPKNEFNNIKVVAYMLDTISWSKKFKGKYAEYAIGGPTVSMFTDSYNKLHSDKKLVPKVVDQHGYTLRWSDSSTNRYRRCRYKR